MAFLNPEEKKEFGGGFFKWTDGATYRMFIGKKIEERFSDGKKFLTLVCMDRETGETHELKYQFALIDALEKMGDSYADETTPLVVCPKKMGEREYKGKIYDDFEFIVSVDTGAPALHEAFAKNAGVKIEDIPL